MSLLAAIDENGRLKDLGCTGDALHVATVAGTELAVTGPLTDAELRLTPVSVTMEQNVQDPAVIVTEQDLTDTYVAFGAVQDMEGVATLGVLVTADVNASETVTLRVMGQMTLVDAPFEIDAVAAKTLWTTGAADFEKYYEFAAGVLPFVVIQAKAVTPGNVAAYLTGGTGAEGTFGTWGAITDASFQIGIDGTVYKLDGIDFTGVTSMDDVAAVLQAELRVATGSTETVVWSTDKFVITSSISTAASEVDNTDTFERTDISGVGATPFMDAEVGVGTATARAAAFLTGGANAETTILTWSAISDGSLRIGIDGTDYNIDGLDFGAVTDMDEVAAALQVAIRVATSSTETCVWSTDKFIITSADATAASDVTVATTSTGTVGTDISGPTLTDLDVTNAVPTAVAAAFLTGGALATAVIATWNAVANGAFGIQIDGVAYDLGELDFSAITSMADVASVLQVAIRAATTNDETVIWDTDKFIITSADLTSTSEVTVTSTFTETDISGVGTAWMDAEVGVGTQTPVVLAGDLTLTVLRG